jgi:dTDP-4-dehydrorhamnose 3,5-epimerase
MKFIETNISGIVICEPEVFGDERGYFFESFNQKEFEKFVGFKVNFCQDNESSSGYGTLRGLHFQTAPHTQSKLVRVVKGEVLDIAVDLRKKSETFGDYVSIVLSDINKKQLFIPKGFAHGFVVLSDYAIFSYKVDDYYTPNSECGIIFNDKYLNIDWIVNRKDIVVSKKDSNNLDFGKVVQEIGGGV